MIFVGLDDTDVPGSPGTNQLARRLAAALPRGCRCRVALRHQLLFDSRVPYTSHNGCASLLIEAPAAHPIAELLPLFQAEIRAWYVSGSDPGLCLTEQVPPAVRAFGRRCQREVVPQPEARALAAECGLHLEGFGGTEDGVIGALAAVGLLAGGGDGRVVHRDGWPWPDDFTGWQPVAAVIARGVQEIRVGEDGPLVASGTVDVGRHLRPGYRRHRVVLMVERVDDAGPQGKPRWRALKLD